MASDDVLGCYRSVGQCFARSGANRGDDGGRSRDRLLHRAHRRGRWVATFDHLDPHGRHVGLATGAELNSYEVLLACAPDELRHSYRDRLLGKLFAYDREHQSDLVLTLRVFQENSGSWSRCAQQLHIHVNTLRYRIRRIEELTGRDLADLSARVDFYLAFALRARADWSVEVAKVALLS